jgi:hypothetical protein
MIKVTSTINSTQIIRFTFTKIIHIILLDSTLLLLDLEKSHVAKLEALNCVYRVEPTLPPMLKLGPLARGINYHSHLDHFMQSPPLHIELLSLSNIDNLLVAWNTELSIDLGVFNLLHIRSSTSL